MRPGLYVLLIGAREQSERAAMRAAADLDPWSRYRARKTLSRRTEEAMLAAGGSAQSDHVTALAYLYELGKAPKRVDDRQAVIRTFHSHNQEPRRPRLPIAPIAWTTFACLVLVTSYLVFQHVRAPLPSSVLPQMTSQKGAWQNGGRPLPLPELEHFLKVAFPNYVVALNQDSTTTLPTVPVPALSAAFAHLGAAANQAKAGRASFEEDGRRLLQAVRACNDRLGELDAGYYLDGTLMLSGGKRLVVITSYEVQYIRWYQVGEHRIRALRLTRIDSLNYELPVLGFVRPELRDALLLVDNIDEQVGSRLLVSMVPKASLSVWDGPANQYRHVVNEYIREELAQHVDSETGKQVGELLLRRHDELADLGKALDAAGYALNLPRRYYIDVDALDQARGSVATAELAALAATQSELAHPHNHRLFARFWELVAQSVERHELQHRWDFLQAQGLPLPQEIAGRTGPLFRTGERNELAHAVRDETSAYLSELARGPELPLTNLFLLTGFAVQPASHGRTESYAALTILEALAHELEVEHGELLVNRHIQVDVCAQLSLALAEQGGGAVRTAARSAWHRLFGQPLPPLRSITKAPTTFR